MFFRILSLSAQAAIRSRFKDARHVPGDTEDADDDRRQGVEGGVALRKSVHPLGGLLEVGGGGEIVGVLALGQYQR